MIVENLDTRSKRDKLEKELKSILQQEKELSEEVQMLREKQKSLQRKIIAIDQLEILLEMEEEEKK
jgi:uncharacterized protein YlxW (UPF0749 family)